MTSKSSVLAGDFETGVSWLAADESHDAEILEDTACRSSWLPKDTLQLVLERLKSVMESEERARAATPMKPLPVMPPKIHIAEHCHDLLLCSEYGERRVGCDVCHAVDLISGYTCPNSACDFDCCLDCYARTQGYIPRGGVGNACIELTGPVETR